MKTKQTKLERQIAQLRRLAARPAPTRRTHEEMTREIVLMFCDAMRRINRDAPPDADNLTSCHTTNAQPDTQQ